MTEEISLTLGSSYRILSLGSRDEMLETRGVFKGIVSVGTVDGLALEVRESPADLKGKVRVIPSHVVLAIDILEAAKKEEEAEDEVHMHYG